MFPIALLTTTVFILAMANASPLKAKERNTFLIDSMFCRYKREYMYIIN
jgi:hypothetical protein